LTVQTESQNSLQPYTPTTGNSAGKTTTIERISFFSGQEFVIFVSFLSVSVVIFFTEDIMPKPYSLDLRATYSRQKSVKTTSLTQGTTKNNRPKQFVIRFRAYPVLVRTPKQCPLSLWERGQHCSCSHKSDPTKATSLCRAMVQRESLSIAKTVLKWRDD